MSSTSRRITSSRIIRHLELINSLVDNRRYLKLIEAKFRQVKCL